MVSKSLDSLIVIVIYNLPPQSATFSLKLTLEYKTDTVADTH